MVKKSKDFEGKWKRALADYRNLEKRFIKEKQGVIQFANAALIDKLLGILDDLEKAARHLKNEGLDLILEQFKRALESEGLTEIKAKGEKFNPEKMDAVEIVKGKNKTDPNNQHGQVSSPVFLENFHQKRRQDAGEQGGKKQKPPGKLNQVMIRNQFP